MSMKGNKLCIIYLSILFVFVSGLLALPNVHAKGNELEKEHIHAYVHENGSATITEERKVHISEGTEMFIVIGNLGKSEIKDFTVKENGETFTYVDDWDIDASLEDKRKKNGIIKNGSATITEERKVHISEGTEMFIVIGNLGKSEIKDFTVKENGETFTYVDDWDIDASLEDKRKKNGIIKNGSEYELVWGVGDYGDHTYTVEYTITDFVKQLEDDQMIFWRFVNDQTNVPPENVTVEIETDKEFDKDTEKIWAFGYKGDIHFVGDRIVAKSDKALTDSNYVTVLVQLPEGAFQTNDTLDKTFAEVKDEAFEGSDYKDNGKSLVNKTVTIISTSVVVIGLVVGLYFIIKGIIKRLKQWSLKNSLKGQYYREIPYEGDITVHYYLLKKMHETNLSKIFAAYLLKWIYDERIDIKTVKKKFIFTKEEQVIHILESNFPKLDYFEVDLFDLILSCPFCCGKY